MKTHSEVHKAILDRARLNRMLDLSHKLDEADVPKEERWTYAPSIWATKIMEEIEKDTHFAELVKRGDSDE